MDAFNIDLQSKICRLTCSLTISVTISVTKITCTLILLTIHGKENGYKNSPEVVMSMVNNLLSFNRLTKII